jgi:carbamoyl-phosphate synthase large subunit
MTDPAMADVTYIEPITWQTVAAIIEQGTARCAAADRWAGRTALNCALDLAQHGVLEKFDVELIGATQEAIDKAEDRAEVQGGHDQHRPGSAPLGGIAHSMDEALRGGRPTSASRPCIRPSFTAGRHRAAALPTTEDEFIEICERGLDGFTRRTSC